MAAFYEIKTAALGNLLTLSKVKGFLRIDQDIIEDNTLVKSLMTAAILGGEKFCNRVFENRTYTGHFSGVEDSSLERKYFVELRRSPLVSVTSVKTMVNSVLTTVDASVWERKKLSGFSRILFSESLSADDIPYPLQIEFVAGYGADFPDDLRTALYQHILFLYENRGDVQSEMVLPSETEAIYSSYRVLNTYG